MVRSRVSAGHTCNIRRMYHRIVHVKPVWSYKPAPPNTFNLKEVKEKSQLASGRGASLDCGWTAGQRYRPDSLHDTWLVQFTLEAGNNLTSFFINECYKKPT